MGLFSRLFGICKTRPPADPACWRLEEGQIEIDLAAAPELGRKGGAVRLEGSGLPERVLVFRGEDGGFYALSNRCTHMGRRLDPLPGSSQVECCSVSRSRYDYQGTRTAG
ncbi:MAG: Rieske 2Fe-2S domain-containing protein, partial [Thermodesulfobacteriota bacterium]